jgi:phytoene synthase
MNPVSRKELVHWANKTIARGSKSFGVASKLLPRRERENAWLLYAWCRACDDITDGQQLGFYGSGLRQTEIDIWALTRAAVRSQEPVPKPFEAIRRVRRDAALPIQFIEDHLRGFDLDRVGWRPETQNDLIGYCFHVAGAVGRLMAVVMGVEPKDEDTLDRASDLGISFQLNNIVRDIVDDAKEGRCYIPADWLVREGMKENSLGEREYRPQLAKFARELNELACIYDASARVGAARLGWRCRLAILAAANIYGAIGSKVVSRGHAAWDSRTSTPALEKFGAVISAFLQASSRVKDPGRKGLFNRSAWYASGGYGSEQTCL